MASLTLLCALLAFAGCSAAVDRSIRKLRGKVELPAGCLYDGRWHSDGSAVGTREACLACACARGALSCRRRACAPLPEPPPHCQVLQRRGECCPQIQCPDGVNFMNGQAQLEETEVAENFVGLALPACVEGGTVYAAGSAMSSSIACEQCFCLGGARRCVRPQCLPPPPGCQPRPAPGACCPQRYYCEHDSDVASERNPNDCQTSQGKWIGEGERVASGDDCSQCFCLRGAIRCQHLSCAPNLQGCKPLVQAGQCCPHQYQCNHTRPEVKPVLGIIHNLFTHPENYLEPSQNEDRSFHPSKSTKRETTIKTISTPTDKSTSVPTSKKQPTTSTTDVKTSTTQLSAESDSTVMTETTVKLDDYTKDSTTVTEQSTTEEVADSQTTEQPEGSVKIMINGTINCTAELSSTSLLYNITNINDTLKMHMETQPRIPFVDSLDIETHTFPANELITEKSYNEDFDDNESFVINVTSSLRTNTSFPSSVSTSTTVTPKTVSPMLADSHNITKKTKEESDYDYNEPTLPPSLPNLKIIPFVAADAVVDDDDIAPKEDLSYPALDREDKFPVYYPNIVTKDIPYATRREDVYNPTQYPVFPNKEDSLYPLPHEIPETYAGHVDDLESPMEFTVGTSFGSAKEIKTEPKISITTDNMKVETPAVNLFSPPVETEGGFIPKGPGIIDEYYAIYPSTPSGPVMPHLTTSMQLDEKGQCISNDGQQVAEGESVMQACSICTCAWGELHCSPRPCNTPPGCIRRLVTAGQCCGELVCDRANKTKITSTTTSTTTEANKITNITLDTSQNKGAFKNNTETKPPSINTTTIKNNENTSSDTNGEYVGKNPNISSTVIPTSTVVITTTEKQTSQHDISTKDQTNQSSQSQEYEDEDDDEGFSLGNVLKLLLSETYETTTTVPFKKMPPNVATNLPKRTTTTPAPTTTRKPPVVSNFVPSNQYSFIPSKKLNTVDRIDHLVLGEATAIKRTTTRPTTPKPFTPTRKPFSKPTPRPITTKTIEITSKGQSGQAVEVSRPSNMLPGLIPGLPKLAGCNIYGRMYHVGRMIAELSSPCQECKCTELGVQCRPLMCS
ncbi:mucin-5AC-like [Zerene cesonia]|uniref:mucin-5AC-like n=1 Tax=Zerene cesonia TaxID=33412 RepID=UPI0018E54F51|nr:mucin-5AC-like [Zerene cesonia]